MTSLCEEPINTKGGGQTDKQTDARTLQKFYSYDRLRFNDVIGFRHYQNDVIPRNKTDSVTGYKHCYFLVKYTLILNGNRRIVTTN